MSITIMHTNWKDEPQAWDLLFEQDRDTHQYGHDQQPLHNAGEPQHHNDEPEPPQEVGDTRRYSFDREPPPDNLERDILDVLAGDDGSFGGSPRQSFDPDYGGDGDGGGSPAASSTAPPTLRMSVDTDRDFEGLDGALAGIGVGDAAVRRRSLSILGGHSPGPGGHSPGPSDLPPCGHSPHAGSGGYAPPAGIINFETLNALRTFLVFIW